MRSEGDVVKITNGREAVRPIIQLPNSSCPASRSFIMSTVRHLSLADGPANQLLSLKNPHSAEEPSVALIEVSA